MTCQAAKGKRVVIVGGGIAGLSVAHRLAGHARDESFSIRLLEASDELGGLIRTEKANDCLLESGPDTLVAQKPAGLALCRELGLEPELEFPARNGGLHILNRRTIAPLPEGFRMMAPTRLWPTLRSPVFSVKGKARMACELLVPRRRGNGDESLGDFVRRRAGREVLERVVEPILASIYLTHVENLSVQALMPQLPLLERRFGSLTKGYRATRKREGEAPGFFSLKGGLGDLVHRMAATLPEETAQTGARLARLGYDAQAGRWRMAVENGPALFADAVVMACPAHAGAAFLAKSDPVLAHELASLHYASCITVNLVYRRRDVGHPLSVNGFFVPRAEGLSFIACNFVSTKFPRRAPESKAVLRVFVGGADGAGLLQWEESRLVDRVAGELADLLDIRRPPLDVRVFRYDRAMPQIEVGFPEKARTMDRLLDTRPGLFMAGGATGAVGIPDCVASGWEAAERTLAYLREGRASRLGRAV